MDWGEEPFLSQSLKDFFSYARFSGSACPDYSETSPLGHLYSRDISIHGTQNFVLEKCSYNLYICYLYLGETDTCGPPNPGLTIQQGFH